MAHEREADLPYFGLTQRKKPLMIVGGYSYLRDKANGRSVYWKCTEAREEYCRGRAKTVDGLVVPASLSEHNHAPDPTAVHIARARQEMRDRAAATTESTAQILSRCTDELEDSVAAQLPRLSTLKRDIQRTRVRAGNVPANPVRLSDLDLPEEYRLTIVETDFLLHDSGPEDGEDRFLVFATHDAMEKLVLAEKWLADGTFKTVPKLFSQLYSIHAVIDGQVLPCVFALLPNKAQATYERMFDALLAKYPDLSPSTVLIDFEKSAINAFYSRFNGVNVQGCFFHLSQNIFKHVQREGLQGLYSTDPDFALFIRKIAALAFVPQEDVAFLFEMLQVAAPPRAEVILQYFERYYIGLRHGPNGQRGMPMFPVPLWNVFRQVIDDHCRTNNHVEGWHRRFSSKIACHHPTVWKLINALKSEERQTAHAFERLVAGQGAPARKRKYVLLDQRLKRLVEEYEGRDQDEFLRGIAHNLTFVITWMFMFLSDCFILFLHFFHRTVCSSPHYSFLFPAVPLSLSSPRTPSVPLFCTSTHATFSWSGVSDAVSASANSVHSYSGLSLIYLPFDSRLFSDSFVEYFLRLLYIPCVAFCQTHFQINNLST